MMVTVYLIQEPGADRVYTSTKAPVGYKGPGTVFSVNVVLPDPRLNVPHTYLDRDHYAQSLDGQQISHEEATFLYNKGDM